MTKIQAVARKITDLTDQKTFQSERQRFQMSDSDLGTYQQLLFDSQNKDELKKRMSVKQKTKKFFQEIFSKKSKFPGNKIILSRFGVFNFNKRNRYFQREMMEVSESNLNTISIKY